MSEEIFRVSLSFARGNGYSVAGVATTVANKMYAVPEYANPPVTSVALLAANDALSTSLSEQTNGGKLATAEKDRCLAEVVQLLKKLAYFVQIHCQNRLELILASGFEACSNNRSRSPLAKPEIRRIDSSMAGQNVLTVGAYAGVRSWLAESALIGEDGVTGLWVSAPPATDSRAIRVIGLQSGAMYAHRVRGVGGSYGCSEWSDTVNHRAS